MRSEERRVGKECRSRCDWSSDVCSSDLPGIVYTRGRSSYSVNVPIGLLRNRLPNPYTGNAGDATFPDYVVVAGYSYRFGGGPPAPTVSIPGFEPTQPEVKP